MTLPAASSGSSRARTASASPAKHAGGELGEGDLGPGAERPGERVGVEAGGEGVAVPGDLEEQRVRVVARKLAGQGGEALRVLVGEPVEDVLAQRLGLAVLEDAELRGGAGLQREAADQRLAEGVDGLDAQAARRLQRAGEEGAGACEIRRGALAQRVEGRGERAVGQHRPGAERAEQAVLHLGGGRLGVGEAEDLLRLAAREQQPRHPVGEDAGLAGAGIGGDPGGGRRVRGAELGAGGVLDHQSSSGRSPSAHSPLRERWS